MLELTAAMRRKAATRVRAASDPSWRATMAASTAWRAIQRPFWGFAPDPRILRMVPTRQAAPAAVVAHDCRRAVSATRMALGLHPCGALSFARFRGGCSAGRWRCRCCTARRGRGRSIRLQQPTYHGQRTHGRPTHRGLGRLAILPRARFDRDGLQSRRHAQLASCRAQNATRLIQLLRLTAHLLA